MQLSTNLKVVRLPNPVLIRPNVLYTVHVDQIPPGIRFHECSKRGNAEIDLKFQNGAPPTNLINAFAFNRLVD